MSLNQQKNRRFHSSGFVLFLARLNEKREDMSNEVMIPEILLFVNGWSSHRSIKKKAIKAY
jgi:hypothetical protein